MRNTAKLLTHENSALGKPEQNEYRGLRSLVPMLIRRHFGQHGLGRLFAQARNYWHVHFQTHPSHKELTHKCATATKLAPSDTPSEPQAQDIFPYHIGYLTAGVVIAALITFASLGLFPDWASSPFTLLTLFLVAFRTASDAIASFRRAYERSQEKNR